MQTSTPFGNRQQNRMTAGIGFIMPRSPMQPQTRRSRERVFSLRSTLLCRIKPIPISIIISCSMKPVSATMRQWMQWKIWRIIFGWGTSTDWISRGKPYSVMSQNIRVGITVSMKISMPCRLAMQQTAGFPWIRSSSTMKQNRFWICCQELFCRSRLLTRKWNSQNPCKPYPNRRWNPSCKR